MMRWYSRTGTQSEKDFDTAAMTMGSGLPGKRTLAATGPACSGAGGAGLGVNSGVGVATGGSVGGAVVGVSVGGGALGPAGSDGPADGPADGSGVVSGGAPVVGLHPTRTAFGVGLPTGDAEGLSEGESVGVAVGVGVVVGVGVAVATATWVAVGLAVGVGEGALSWSAAAVPTNARIITTANPQASMVDRCVER